MLPCLYCACNGCGSVNYTVSSPTTEPTASHRLFTQSETSMVRVDQPAGRSPREPAARYIVGYNDTTDVITGTGDSSCWRFIEVASLDGWASSEAFGGDWTRHPQMGITQSIKAQGVAARHGDPWLAAWSSKDPKVPGIVLYVSVAQHTLDHLGGPWYLVVSRSLNGGRSFATWKAILGPQDGIPDGPKIAITGDGQVALVVWNQPSLGGIPFRLLWDLAQPTMQVTNTGIISPTAIASPPDPSCTFFGAAFHPHVAAGFNTLYVAAVVTYRCGNTFTERLEVYRNIPIGIALGAPFLRILSVAPPSMASSTVGVLNAQNISVSPSFGTRTDRGSSLPALAVAQDASGEIVVVADLAVRPGTEPDESQIEKVVQWRLPNADTCDARNHKGDLDSCGSRLTAMEVDSLSTPSKMDSVAHRAGIWESKVAAFSGRVPDGTIDPRIGMIWYSQPYKGLISVTDEMRTRTIVEGVVSKDGGLSYTGPFTLTAHRADDPLPRPEDDNIGFYFYPCQMLCSGYFGEYLSGVFEFLAPSTTAIVGTWGDSREGCTDQGIRLKHQHVWAGAIRPK